MPISEEQVRESYKDLAELAGKSHGAALQAKLALEQETLLRGVRQVRSTHHALVVDATARGQGFLPDWMPAGGMFTVLMFGLLAYESFQLMSRIPPARYYEPDDRLPWEREHEPEPWER